MLNFKRNKAKTVAEKVDELITESNGVQSSEESEDETAPKVAEFDEDEYALPDGRTTDIRKRNIKLLAEQSAKYRGKITSRKDLDMAVDSESEKELELDDSEADDDVEEQSSEEAAESDDSDDDDDEAALKAFGQQLQVGSRY